MPRQDVPYGGAICRLRERIAEIWDKLGEKLHSINGVEGDGQGNVLIRSDSAALTITDDQVQHEIVLDLDTSQLPAADVNSVNGQTGVVALTADDIPSDNGDVQTDLDNLAGADITLQGNINAEALARQNADSTLQTNINAALATIPGEVSSQIASNAAIIQLQSDVLAIPNKVDKRTGTGKFAYTHDGATQGDIALVDGTTGATIPIRDANGRMQAANPASGDTSQKLATTNWISQTGDGSPNNLVHRTADETINGQKSLPMIYNRLSGTLDAINQWSPIYEFKTTNPSANNRLILLFHNLRAANSANNSECGIVTFGFSTSASYIALICGNVKTGNDFAISRTLSGTEYTWTIWFKGQIVTTEILVQMRTFAINEWKEVTPHTVQNNIIADDVVTLNGTGY